MTTVVGGLEPLTLGQWSSVLPLCPVASQLKPEVEVINLIEIRIISFHWTIFRLVGTFSFFKLLFLYNLYKLNLKSFLKFYFFPMPVSVDRLKLLVLVCWGECQAHKHFTTVIYSCSKVYNNDLRLIIYINFYANFSIFSRLKALALPSILIRPLGLWTQDFQLGILIIYFSFHLSL